MAVTKRTTNFFTSPEGLEIVETLTVMAADATYNTRSSYSANSTLYPDNVMTFVDKHVNYLIKHPTMDPQQYISNLRLMTRVRK